MKNPHADRSRPAPDRENAPREGADRAALVGKNASADGAPRSASAVDIAPAGGVSRAASVLLAAAAGLVSGIFGALGGIAVMYLASKINPPKTPSDVRDNHALTLSVTLAVSAVSAITYAVRGNIEYGAVVPYIVPAALGGLCGAILCDRLPAAALRLLFAAVTVWAGVKMIGG